MPCKTLGRQWLGLGKTRLFLGGEQAAHHASDRDTPSGRVAMRVLFWSLGFWPNIGGIEVLAAKLLPALRERGHEFIVVAPKSHSELPDETQYQGFPIHRFCFQGAPNSID